MAKTTHFVGLDVHAGLTRVAGLERETGELQRRRLQGDPVVALPLLEKLGPGTLAVYEAGRTGFGLARAAAERGLVVRVCAPGLVMKAPTDRVKTDARDAERLARLLAAGELSFVPVPTVPEEQLRDLVRAREDLRGDLNRARQRLSHFLRAGATLHRSRQELDPRALGLAARPPVQRPGLGRHLRRLPGGRRGHRATAGHVEAALEELAPHSPWAGTIARLRCLRGIDTLAAVGLCAEIGDFDRFGHPRQLGAFLGLVPAERPSDEKPRQGAITEAGPKHSRRLLVEAGKHCWRRPRISEDLRRRQQGQDPRVCTVA
jgi:transposase